MKLLVNYFVPYLNFDDYNANHASNTQQTLYLEAFVAILESVRTDIHSYFYSIFEFSFDLCYMLAAKD